MPSKSVYTEEYRMFLAMLVEVRQKAGLSQQQVADRLGRPQSYVSRYESGQTRIDTVELVRLARVIGFDAASMVRKIDRAVAHHQS